VDAVTQNVSALEYSKIQAFYARHWQLSDQGLVDECALTFAEDAEYLLPPPPMIGREAIADRLRAFQANQAYREAHIQHWVGMSVATPLSDDLVRVRSYVTAFETVDGSPKLMAKVTLEDELLRDGDGFLIKKRQLKDLAIERR
jgi:hypothetical protein